MKFKVSLMLAAGLASSSSGLFAQPRTPRPPVATAAAPASGPTGALLAGSAKVDITPPQSSIKAGDSIRDPLFVRALVISNGTTCAVLVGMDQTNVPTNDEEAIARASQSTGCPVESFIVSATHTHSANSAGLQPTGMPTEAIVNDAILKAVEQAKASMKPARIGFGTTDVYLNVNRDRFLNQQWGVGTMRSGASDKTLAVFSVVGRDGMPIGVVMNYAMHPLNYYLTGIVSADAPGEASRYVERRYPNAVAIFNQAAAGDQMQLLNRPWMKSSGVRTRIPGAANDSVDAEDQWTVTGKLPNSNRFQNAEMQKPMTEAELPAYRSAVEQTSEITTAVGAIIGESAIDVMTFLTPQRLTEGKIYSEMTVTSCPGRRRLDNSRFEGYLPPYEDAAPVAIKVGLIRIGDINFASVNGEVYSEINTRLKREAPAKKLMMVTIAGNPKTGYIASNNAGDHLTFQVIGSRLKPGCAEDKIVNSALSMLRNADHEVPAARPKP